MTKKALQDYIKHFRMELVNKTININHVQLLV